MEVTITFKGMAEEVGRILRVIQPALEGTEAWVAADDDSDRFVTVKFARRVLTRRPISDNVKALIEALVEAHPEYVSAAALHEAIDCTPEEFRGVMGSFGRRVSNTDGYDSEADFWDWRWNDADKTYEYRLPDTVREALRLEQLD